MIYINKIDSHKMDPKDLPYEKYDGKYVLGIEGSANKIGVGIVDFYGNILSNPR